MRKVVSAGGVIFKGTRLLVVRHKGGHYGFPKGHVEPGETIEQTAVREVREEAALESEIIRHLGKINRNSTESNGERVNKDIELFLMRVTGKADVVPEEKVLWLPLDEALVGPWRPAELAFLRTHADMLSAWAEQSS